MVNTMKKFLIIAALIIFGIGGWMFFGKDPKNTSHNKKPANKDTELVEEKTMPQTWQTYTDEFLEFSIDHPQDMQIRASEIPGQNPSISFFIAGPTQIEGTEFYDGISIEVSRGTYTDPELKEFAEQEINLLQQNMLAEEIIEPLTEITFAGKTAYRCEIRSISGARFTRIYTPADAGQFFLVTIFAEDPSGVGFAQTVNQMLESFKIIN